MLTPWQKLMVRFESRIQKFIPGHASDRSIRPTSHLQLYRATKSRRPELRMLQQQQQQIV